VNRHAVALARKLGRQVIFPGDATKTTAFEAVTMWETLEHIDDPLAALQDARSRLKPDGLLALSVPNLNAPDIRSMRGDSLQIHGGPAWPGHVNLWTPATLALLLRRAGFEPLHMAGQFSTNLEELMAYQLGHWSGARDYLRADAPEFALPVAAKELSAGLGPVAVSWQDGFAFAPILFVLARRADGTAPLGLDAFLREKTAARTQTLAAAYQLSDDSDAPRRRGRTLDLTAPEWRSEGAAIDGARLQIDAEDAGEFAYLWRSSPLDLSTGCEIRVRGVILSGGLFAGLLYDEAWSSTASAARA
jgi:SAM-dependent methyltransferase